MKTNIISVKYADSKLSEKLVFLGGNEKAVVPIVFIIYVIKTEDRVILVDPGCDAMPGFEMNNYILPVDALKEAGIHADEVTDVIITHAHHDHIQAVKHFPNAIVYIQNEEYKSGQKYLEANKMIVRFEESIDVVDGVHIVRIGGHTNGSCIVVVDTDTKKYVIAGDECYKKICIEKKILPGNHRNLENSMAFFEKYDGEEYEVLLCHEEYIIMAEEKDVFKNRQWIRI